MARTNIPVTNQSFGTPHAMHGDVGVTLIGHTDGGKVKIDGPSTFIMVVNNGPIAGNVTIKAQRAFRPADSRFPQQSVPDLVWVVDDTAQDTYVFGPIPPAYVNSQGYAEIDVTDDGMGGDIVWHFRAIKLV